MGEVGWEAYGERLATCVTSKLCVVRAVYGSGGAEGVRRTPCHMCYVRALSCLHRVWVRWGGRRTANALPHVLRLSVVLSAQCMGEVGREAYGERLATCVTSKLCVVRAVYG